MIVTIRHRCTRRDDQQDAGFALVFCLLVITMVTAVVGTMFFIAAPDVLSSKQTQDNTEAVGAAQAGVDDAIAYLSSVPACQSQTRMCPQAFGASSAALAGTSYQRTTALGTGQSFSWSTGSAATADGYVRVTATGTYQGTSKTMVADLNLQKNDVLGLGHWADYEASSPKYLASLNARRSIVISDYQALQAVNVANTSGQTVSAGSTPTTVNWNGPPTSGTNPNPTSVCGQHWYYDSPTSPGRYTSGNDSWGETGTINGNTVLHTGGCSNYLVGTVNSPFYSRDAIGIGDNTAGVGPTFRQPIQTAWGEAAHNTPAPPSGNPYRISPGNSGLYAPGTPYKIQIAPGDITLPNSVNQSTIPANACVYYGPTRVKLNGNHTATITSPATKTVPANADRACYPSSLTNGVVQFVVNYQTTGAGVILVKNAGTVPSGDWPSNPTKPGAATAGNSVMFLKGNGTGTGSTTPDQPNTLTAPDSGCATTAYSLDGNATCAWTQVNSPSDGGGGWTSYTQTPCSGASVTNRQLFECEYGQLSSGSSPAVSQTGGYYATLRNAFKTDLSRSNCITYAAMTDKLNCYANVLNNDLASANTGRHAPYYGSPAYADHQYVVDAYYCGYGRTTDTSPQLFGTKTSNVNPTPNDSFFTFNNQSEEAASQTPCLLLVGREQWDGKNWTDYTQPAFGLNVTLTSWSVVMQADTSSYFPNQFDVTQYATGTDASGNAAGSSGVNQPGDMYVDGSNSGKLSLVADHDVVVTGSLTAASGNLTTDAADIVAGNNIRYYNPVRCADLTGVDLANTSAGSCPDDLTGLYARPSADSNGNFYSYAIPAQYVNLLPTGDREIDADQFALSGTIVPDNVTRGGYEGTISSLGGEYTAFEGYNFANWGNGALTGFGTSLNFVNLQNANLPWAPLSSNTAQPRVWDVVSISPGS